MGLSMATNPVTVNGTTAYRKGEYFRQQLPVVTGSVNEIVIFSNYPWAVPAFLFRPSNQAK